METRPEPRPRTRTTGVLPRRPQVLARGGVIDWSASSSKTTQALFTAAVLLPAARPPASTVPPHRHRVRSPVGRAAARTSRAASAAATCPPSCTRRGTGDRSASSLGRASTADQPTHGPADRAPTPLPAWLSACPTAAADQAIPSTSPLRGRSRATGAASVPPTAPRRATRQQSPDSSPRSRSTPRPGADPLPRGPLSVGQATTLRISHPTSTTEAACTLSGEQPDITRSSSVASLSALPIAMSNDPKCQPVDHRPCKPP